MPIVPDIQFVDWFVQLAYPALKGVVGAPLADTLINIVKGWAVGLLGGGWYGGG